MSEPELQLPEHIHPLADKESFTFACHPGVPCFTECCRDLELAHNMRVEQSAPALGLFHSPLSPFRNR